MKLILRKQLQPSTISAKYSLVDFWQSFEYAPGSEYGQVHGQCFEDVRVTEGYENTRNIPEYTHLSLNMPEYVLLCLKS